MKRKRVMFCLFCGIRIGAAKSPFCVREVKDLMIKKHRPHHFQWSWIFDGCGWYGKGINDMLNEMWKEAYIKELESRIEDLLSVVKEYRGTLTGAVGRSLDYLIERNERKKR